MSEDEVLESIIRGLRFEDISWDGLSRFYRDTGRQALADQTRRHAEKELR
jgi:hypothetical protein